MSTTTQPGYAYGGTGGYPYGSYTGYPAGYPQPPAPRRRPRSPLGIATLSLALLAFGVLLALDATEAVTIPGVVLVAVPLLVVGLGLLAVARTGARAGGLVAVGVVLLVVTAAVASAPRVDVTGDWGSGTGDRTWTPTSVAAAESGYDLGAGDARLDLTAVPLTGADAVAVTAHVGAGQLVVTVPAASTVVLDSHVGLGQIRLPAGTADGRETGGIGVDRTLTLTPAGPSTGTLELDLEVGIGNLEVRRAVA